MKKTICLAMITVSSILSAQVIIGNDVGSASNKTSVLLEFAQGENKGIILPYTRNLPTSPTEGTVLLDAENATTARIKYYNGSWIDLSGQDADITAELAQQPDTNQVTEDTGAKTIIGANNSAADGVLVLESQTKALLLPTVENTDNIVNPSPGMLVFINKTGAKRLAVYNGSKWSYWQASN